MAARICFIVFMIVFHFKITKIQSTSSIILSCQPSYLLIKPPSNSINLSTSTSHCSLRRKDQLIFDTTCLKNNSSLLIQSAPKYIETENPQIFRTTCADVINDYSTFQQKPVKMIIKEMKDEALSLDILIFNQTIIDNRSLYPTVCQLIDANEEAVLISDESGCPVNDNFKAFNVSRIGNHRLFSSKLQLNYASHGSIRIQCSLVPCGMECLKTCPHERQSFGFANQQILSQTVFITKHHDLSQCDFSVYRISLIMIFIFLIILTTFFTFVAYRMFPKTHLIQTIHMLKHMYRSEKRSKKIQIIHPFDHFSSPPIITNESVASIKANLAKSDFHDENYKNNYENDHLDINELERCQTNSTEIYLTPSVLDSLPDPPSISIKDLQRTIQMNDRKERIQLPQPIPRWSSNTREATYAVPPPPPAHATSLYHKPQTLTSSIHSPVSNASSIISSSSLNGLAMIDDEIEFNTLDKPLSQHFAHELRKKFRNINQPFDNREIEF